MTVNAAAPAAEMVKAPEALPPLFTRVNARSGLPPIDTKPNDVNSLSGTDEALSHSAASGRTLRHTHMPERADGHRAGTRRHGMSVFSSVW